MHPNILVTECDLGMGLFARRDFVAGERILQFTGRVINTEQVSAMGEKEANPLQIGRNLYIDLDPPGVFINHSCRPNTGIRNSIELIALQAIAAGEEFRFDYSTTMSERRWTMPCLCGVYSCRGVADDFHNLPQALKQQYLSLGIVQPFIVVECQIQQKADYSPVYTRDKHS